MKNIIIIGARGLGRTIYGYLEEFDTYKKDFFIKGFLDDNKEALDGYGDYAQIIGTVDDYKISDNDCFICAIGDNQYREKYVKIIKDKGGVFVSMVHPLTRIAKDATVGVSCIIGPWTIVESGAKIGDFCLIQTGAIIGHDVSVGDFSRIDSRAICAGSSKLSEYVTVYTGAIVNQNAIVEKNATVGAGSFVSTKVSEGKTAFGNPAREF
jgi:sugar O-acyltransferase (sialic acid O-acetyltransferase NeuD family)